MLVAATAALELLLRSAVPAASAAPSSSLTHYKPTNPAALAHFEAGYRAYKNARDTTRPLTDRVRDLKRAIDEYTADQPIDGAAAFDDNIAHCAKLLVDNATAVAHLQRSLERAGQLDAELRQSVESEIAELDPSGAIRHSASVPGSATVAKPRRPVQPPSTPSGDPGLIEMSPGQWHWSTWPGAPSSATCVGAPEGWLEHGCRAGARAPAHADLGDHRSSRLGWLPATSNTSASAKASRITGGQRETNPFFDGTVSTQRRDTYPFDMRSDRWLSSPRRSKICRRQA